jgi:P4 family phage/plasmid primase-like protien
MIIEIPDKLKQEGIRFILLAEKSKQPIEEKWQAHNNYDFKDEKLLRHLFEGKNYGVLGEKDDLIIIDTDTEELMKWVEENLPQTLTVKTGSGSEAKKHYYFRSEVSNKQVLKKIIDGVEIHYGEIQGKGSYVVGPNSLYPITGNPYTVIKNLKITRLGKEDLEELKQTFCDKTILRAVKVKSQSGNKSDIETQLNLINIIPTSKLIQTRGEWNGPNPWHGSETGHNFWMDTENDVWCCFRCGSGGGVASAIAVKEGLLSCADARGALDKEIYKKVIELAKIKYSYKEIKSENILLGNNIDKALDEFYTDWEQMSEKFCKINPIYYDSHKIFWLWDVKKFKWSMTDETDLMNLIMEGLSKKYSSTTFVSDVKNQILEGLRRVGRKHTPLPVKNTWIQFNNVVVDIENEKQFEATSEYFFTNPIPWKLGESEDTPNMDKLFMEWVGTNSVISLYEYLAYCAYSHMRIHRIFCFIGAGRNGKGQFNKVIRKYVGEDNTTTIDLDLIHSRFEGASLYKKLVCFIGEIDKGIFKKTRGLKALSGDDLVRAEFKGKDKFDFINYAKPIIATNHLPETDDRTDGFFSRWSIAKFFNRFPEGKDIYEVIPDIEYSNFARKSLRVLKELFKRGYFNEDGTIEDRKLKYEEVSSPFKEFLDDECILEVTASVKYSVFYERYDNWLKQKSSRAVGTKAFSIILKRHNLEVKRVNVIKYGKNSTEIQILGVKLDDSGVEEVGEKDEQEPLIFENL